MNRHSESCRLCARTVFISQFCLVAAYLTATTKVTVKVKLLKAFFTADCKEKVFSPKP